MKVFGVSALPAALILALSLPLSSALPRERPTRSHEGTGPRVKNPPPDSLKAQPAAADGARPASVSAQSASAVPVGQVITSCTVPGTIAITFDDGPYIYTQQILDTLKSNGVTATFFVNGQNTSPSEWRCSIRSRRSISADEMCIGQNWGDIMSADSQASVKRAVAEGHQIGSHSTWTPSLGPPTGPRLTAVQRITTRIWPHWTGTASSTR